MKILGIIDIGSNSIRLLLTEIDVLGTYKVLYRQKENIRLGADMKDGVFLNDNRINAALDILNSYKKLCETVHVDEIIAVATEAVRRAKNKDDFIMRIKNDINIDVRVLSGYEEVTYDCLAVSKSINIEQGIVMDIGGASTELAMMEHGRITYKSILPIGAVNLTEKFKLQGVMTSIVENKLKTFLREQFNNISWLGDIDVDTMVGIGGTIRNVAKVDSAIKCFDIDMYHNYILKIKDVKNVFDLIKFKNLEQRKKIKGLNSERADIFVAPVCALYLLLDMLKIDNLIISENGLREGVLFDYIMKKRINSQLS